MKFEDARGSQIRFSRHYEHSHANAQKIDLSKCQSLIFAKIDFT